VLPILLPFLPEIAAPLPAEFLDPLPLVRRPGLADVQVVHVVERPAQLAVAFGARDAPAVVGRHAARSPPFAGTGLFAVDLVDVPATVGRLRLRLLVFRACTERKRAVHGVTLRDHRTVREP